MKNNNFRVFTIVTGILIAGAVLLLRSDSAVKGAADGLSVCINIIIPSLFPFLVLSSFIVRLDIRPRHGSITDKVMRKLFALPGEALPAVLLGLTAGYPAGLKTAELLYTDKRITRDEAQRLSLFAVNSGVPFCVNAVGKLLFGSKEAGLLLLFSTLAANLIIGLITKKFSKPLSEYEPNEKVSSLAVGVCEALVCSVESAVQSTFSMCGWIILFSTFGNIFIQTVQNGVICDFFTCFAEVTAALSFSAKRADVALAAFCLGFGSFSVHCQLLPSLGIIGTRYYKFFISRLSAGAVSSLLAILSARVFKLAVTVNGNIFLPRLSVSPAATFALIFMCSVFILNLANGEKRCYNKKHTERS